MSTEAKNPCGALGQLALRDGTVTVGCGLEKGHDKPRKIKPWMGVDTLPGTPHRFWAEWRDDSTARVVAEEPEWEYGIISPPMGVGWVGSREYVDRTVARFAERGAPFRADEQIVRRVKQGEWVPVKQEGRTDA